jgi:hypothetical protein
MSNSQLRAVFPVLGMSKEPSYFGDTGQLQVGQVEPQLGTFTGDVHAALLWAHIAATAGVALATTDGLPTAVYLADVGVAIVEATVLEFNPASIGAFEPGADPKRKYGSISFWRHDTFVGSRPISRLASRFSLFGGSEDSLSYFNTVLFNSFQYVWGWSGSLDAYSALLDSYLNSLVGVPNLAVTKIGWSLAPSVTISLKTYNACYGVIRQYAH